MVMTNFTGSGVGLGFGVGCGFGVGWGFGGMPLNFLGLGAGGGCGVGFGLGWGFGSGFGCQYRNSRVTFEGKELDAKASDQVGQSKDLSKSDQKHICKLQETLLPKDKNGSSQVRSEYDD